MLHDFDMRLGSVRGVSGVPYSLPGSGCGASQAGAGGLRLPGAERCYCRPRDGQLAGKSVITNFVAAELALRLKVMGVREVDVLHVRAVLNKTANWLGCKAEQGRSGDSEPDCFLGVRRPLRLLLLREKGKEFVGLCQLKSSSRVSVRERCVGRGRGP